jgi:hypothetical protein
MKLKFTILCLLSAAILSSTGCNLFRKNKKPKENPAIASEVEGEFRQRWVERRAAELVGQGTDALNARNQAEKEFQERYPVLKSTGK